MSTLFLVVLSMGLLVWFGGIVRRAFVCECGPDEILIFTGARYVGPDGKPRNHAVLFDGGRRLRLPVIERVDRMEGQAFSADIRIPSVQCQDGVVRNLVLVARMQISRDPLLVHHAIEHFLDRPSDLMREVAVTTLTEQVKASLSALSLAQYRSRRSMLPATVKHQAQEPLQQFGLQLMGLDWV